MKTDTHWMRKALALARSVQGKTHPNPTVGCVIVKNNRLLGQGYHKFAGAPHAEIDALTSCGNNSASGATCYITMEPCNHFGRTPPCTDALIKSGIKRVVIALRDPNPEVTGGGIEKLKAHGIDVSVGIEEEKARKLNEAWIKWIQTGLPFVIIKIAASLDGKVATKTGDSKWITGEKSRHYVHRLRQRVSCVMIGSGTVLSDDPLLTVRKLYPKGPNPLRLIADSRLRSPLQAKIFQNQTDAKTIIATAHSSDTEKKIKLTTQGIEIIELSKSKNGIDLEELLQLLGKKHIESILVEGGPTLAMSFIQSGLADKVLFFIAPLLIGGKNARCALEGEGFDLLAEAPVVKRCDVRRIGRDILVEGYIRSFE
ncbi:bifunctional diaminohydroxyphosphoribosylaminopyrimidine deaminase/5-amino-6-(5-phosphoribosylamino)uracil reductase RibD [bacterium]|nr:bifunctional diaminohydroxyphosphoribosylaminopyrimidine deaminase/5-amino-6-(5-phosphoribosylamino)uracil reductase RibD [candidate division CSSED10-310 bacterium]